MRMQPAVVCIQETRLIKNVQFEVKGYQVIGKDRDGVTRGGGVNDSNSQ